MALSVFRLRGVVGSELGRCNRGTAAAQIPQQKPSKDLLTHSWRHERIRNTARRLNRESTKSAKAHACKLCVAQ
jgi:hypothetical protein